MSLFHQLEELEAQEIVPGFWAKFIHSERMTFAYWTIESEARLPEHSHPHEQVCHVLEGQFELTIDGETKTLSAGSIGVIPSDAIHSGRAVTACRVLDVFQPVRDDYRLEPHDGSRR